MFPYATFSPPWPTHKIWPVVIFCLPLRLAQPKSVPCSYFAYSCEMCLSGMCVLVFPCVWVTSQQQGGRVLRIEASMDAFDNKHGDFQDCVLQWRMWQVDFLTPRHLSLQCEISLGNSSHILGQAHDLRATERTGGTDRMMRWRAHTSQLLGCRKCKCVV